MVLSSDRAPIAYIGDKRAMYVDARDPERVQEFLGQRFEFLPRNLHKFELISDRTGGPNVIHADLADMLRPFCQMIHERWSYDADTRVLRGGHGFGVLEIRFPRDGWPGHFPITAVSFSNDVGYRITWHNFQCDVQPLLDLTQFLGGMRLRTHLTPPTPMPESFTDTIKFAIENHGETLRDTSLKLMYRFEGRLIGGGNLVPLQQFCDQTIEKEGDIDAEMMRAAIKLLHGRHAANCHTFYDREKCCTISVPGYERQRAGIAMEASIGGPMYRRLQKTFGMVATSAQQVDARCLACCGLALLGASDLDDFLDELGGRLATPETPPRVRHSYLALRVVLGRGVRESELDELQKAAEDPTVPWQECAFYLDALCLLDRTRGLSARIRDVFSHDPKDLYNNSIQRQLVCNLPCSKEGRGFIVDWMPGNEPCELVWQRMLWVSNDRQVVTELAEDGRWDMHRPYTQQIALNPSLSWNVRSVAAQTVAHAPLDPEFRRTYVASVLSPPPDRAPFGLDTALLTLPPHYLNDRDDPLRHTEQFISLLKYDDSSINEAVCKLMRLYQPTTPTSEYDSVIDKFALAVLEREDSPVAQKALDLLLDRYRAGRRDFGQALPGLLAVVKRRGRSSLAANLFAGFVRLTDGRFTPPGWPALPASGEVPPDSREFTTIYSRLPQWVPAAEAWLKEQE